MKKTYGIILSLGLCVFLLGGCTNTQMGTAVGGAAGAGIGYALSGGQVAGTLVGAGVGALAGNMFGQAQDDVYVADYYY